MFLVLNAKFIVFTHHGNRSGSSRVTRMSLSFLRNIRCEMSPSRRMLQMIVVFRPKDRRFQQENVVLKRKST